MTLSAKQQIFASNVGSLIKKIFESGYTCTLGEAMRSTEQAHLYAQEGKGINDSLHCKRLAIDLNLFKEGVYQDKTEQYRVFGDYWDSLHEFNRWGGCFKKLPDGNHFEMQDL